MNKNCECGFVTHPPQTISLKDMTTKTSNTRQVRHTGTENHNARIYHGRAATVAEKFPWNVILTMEWKVNAPKDCHAVNGELVSLKVYDYICTVKCSGVLISARGVVTAGHCLFTGPNT